MDEGHYPSFGEAFANDKRSVRKLCSDQHLRAALHCAEVTRQVPSRTRMSEDVTDRRKIVASAWLTSADYGRISRALREHWVRE
jgi:hypothetical protein